MELLARGQTNAEIAERMGLTLDGAKWHVREILSKLNLESREDAAAYWRDYNRPLARISRVIAGFGPPMAVKAVLGGGATLVAVARYLYPAYYQHPLVLESLGEPPRPPFPEGFEVESSDPELLAKLRPIR